ncbi:MAG: Lrp/AsnC family transcriptional regulator [Candidatus Woesearchaeota archaeon]
MDYKLDDKDRSILEILQEHGDYTTRQIAKKTLLPITTVHNRIQKLKKDGIIKKFTIDIDSEAFDKSFLVYVLVSVNLERIKELKKTQHNIAKELKGFYFTERADVVAGGSDIVMVVRVKDVKEFDQVLLGKIQMIDGVKETKSMISIHGN